MTNATRQTPKNRRTQKARNPEGEEALWEQRHVPSTFLLERAVRGKLWEAADARGVSINQFVNQALRDAVADTP